MKRSGWCDGASIDLGREALAALISRESFSTAAIEGEQVDPVEVRSSVARRFQLPPDTPGSPQREASAKVERLVQLLQPCIGGMRICLLQGFMRAGLAHLWFVTLHPYDDGNGRLARALTDRALAQISRPEVEEKPADRLMAGALGLSARIQQQRPSPTRRWWRRCRPRRCFGGGTATAASMHGSRSCSTACSMPNPTVSKGG